MPFELEGTTMRPDIVLKTLMRRIRKNLIEDFWVFSDYKRKKRTKGDLYLITGVTAFIENRFPGLAEDEKAEAVFILSSVFYNKTAKLIYQNRKAEVDHIHKSYD